MRRDPRKAPVQARQDASGAPVRPLAGLRAACMALLMLGQACDGTRHPMPAPGPAPVPSRWTPLTPSSDTRHVYVSSSSGSDANNGLAERSPKATIAAAVALLRNEHPDWLHVRRGDQFKGGLGDWFLSGRSAVEPMVVTTYGAAADRPQFRCGVDSGLTVHSFGVHDVAFVGLEFFADGYDGGNGQPYGISLLAPCTRVLIEDCKIGRFYNNLRFQGPHVDLRLRRSVVTDAFTVSSGHAQGIYVDGVDGCLIEECVFDHNGWLPGVAGANATIFRHNLYIQGNTRNIAIVGNIIARAGSHGLQARSGGEIRDNLFLGNPINMLVGDNIQNSGAVTATVLGNVILDGRDIDDTVRRGWAAQFQCLAAGEIAYNVAAHQVEGTGPRSYIFDSTLGVGVNQVDFHHNIAYRWGAPLEFVGNRFADLLLHNNDLQETTATELFRTNQPNAVPGFVSAGNRLFSAAPDAAWIFYTARSMSLLDWCSVVADGSTRAIRVDYPNPDATIADYDLATGGAGSIESFLARARRQSRVKWNDLLVGTNVSATFRANFGIDRAH